MHLFIEWNVDPDLISRKISPVTIQWYGIMWGLGLLAVFFAGRYVLKTLQKDEDKLTLLIQYVFIAGLIGARLMQVIYYQPAYFLQHPEKIIAVWQGGLASHGGVIGALIGMLLFCRRNRDYSILWTFDHAALIALFLGFLVRLGNLFNSEIVGIPTQVPWAFIFKRVDNIPRHPVVLYESIAYLLIQFLQLLLFRKYKDSKPGLYLMVFFLGVFTIRFFIEFLKEPEGQLLFGLSSTQWLDVPFIITGLVLLYLVSNRKLTYNTPAHA
jgi:phosphatidylglycerol:prolipoprotein diacylglycerol transferase